MPTHIISAGQSSSVSSGVTDTNDLVLSGGTEFVLSGGFTNATTIAFGGIEIVSAGGTAAATTVSGGTLEIQNGGVVGAGGVLFSGTSGTFRIDGTTMPTSTISGFVIGDTIDLAGVSFANGGSVQLHGGNILHVLEGSATYDLQLDPTQNFAGKSFRLSSDGASGTNIQVVSGLTINVTYDASVSGNVSAGAFRSGVDYVVSTFENLFTNGVTLNVTVGYGEENGLSLGSSLGESQQAYFDPTVSYSQVRTALLAQGAPGASTLPISSPTARTLDIGPAEMKALGLISTDGFSFDYDGYVGFTSTLDLSYGINTAPSPFSSYYFVGIVEHEIAEVMGRTSWLDFNNGYSVMDLFRYASAGGRQFTTGGPSYFSIDSGVTPLSSWNNPTSGVGGDLGDWDSAATADAFDNQSFNGVINALTAVDVTNMRAIGWTTAVSVSSGQVVTITAGQTSSGLVVLSGGSVLVSSGGFASATTVLSGGFEAVSFGGTAIGAMVSSGGLQTLSSGFASSTTVLIGGQEQIKTLGLAQGTVVSSGGAQVVSAGGSAVATTASSGGVQTISSGGNANGTIVSNGGSAVVSAGGIVRSAVLLSSGQTLVSSGGSAVATTASSGGVQTVSSGGNTTGTIVSSGGQEIVLAGGIAKSAVVLSGGQELVSGGVASVRSCQAAAP
jgi:autotransporter passenger strand-loop-strand repeat protein